MGRFYFLLLIGISFVVGPNLAEAQGNSKKKKSGETGEITLDRLFPKDSFFGPQARSASFSPDGRFAAYLYRSYDERRHGNDLWIYNFETEKNTRLTNLAMMSNFQRSARVVKMDRLEKHKKAKEAGKETTESVEGSKASTKKAKSKVSRRPTKNPHLALIRSRRKRKLKKKLRKKINLLTRLASKMQTINMLRDTAEFQASNGIQLTIRSSCFLKVMFTTSPMSRCQN